MKRSYRPAPIVDDVLANILRRRPNPVEKLMQDQGLSIFLQALSHANDNIIEKGRIARLECGHFVITKGVTAARCARCGEMIRSGYDYEGFRQQLKPDEFNWPDDPLRELNQGGAERQADNSVASVGSCGEML